MARSELAAKRYAEAVFEIARDQRTIDTWRRDLQTIGAVLGDAEMLALLESAKVPESRKLSVLERSLAGIAPLALNFARLLVQRQRVALAPQIAADFNTLADEYLGIAHANVTTAIAVDDEEQRLIAERLSALTGKRVAVSLRTDPGIMGGIVARIGDTLIDGSTRTRLLALRRRLEVTR